MSNAYFMTPEEKSRKKKRDKYIMYVTIFALTAMLTAAFTVFANQLQEYDETF